MTQNLWRLAAIPAAILAGCRSEAPPAPPAPKVAVVIDGNSGSMGDGGEMESPPAGVVPTSGGGLDLIARARPAEKYEITPGKLVTTIPEEDDLSNMVFSPDGKTLYAADSAFGIVVRSVPSWERTEVWPWTESKRDIEWIVLSRDGGTLVAAHEDGLITVWSTATGEMIHRHEYVADEDSMGGVFRAAAGLAITPDGKLVASADGGSFGYSVWTAATGKEVWKQKTGWRDVKPADFNPKGDTLALIGVKQFLLCDAATGKPTLTVPLGESLIETAEYSPDGRHILVDRDDEVQGKQRCVLGMLDAATGKLEWSVDTGYSWQYGSNISPDGSLIAIVGERRTEEGFAEQRDTIQIRHAKDGRLHSAFQSKQIMVAPKACFSPDGKLLAVDKEIWEVPPVEGNAESSTK